MPEAAKAPKSVPQAGDAKDTGDKAEKAKPSVRRTNFAELYPDDKAVRLVVTENPKKDGSKSRARFEGYTGAKTIGDARKAGITYQDIVYDIGHGFIAVG